MKGINSNDPLFSSVLLIVLIFMLLFTIKGSGLGIPRILPVFLIPNKLNSLIWLHDLAEQG